MVSLECCNFCHQSGREVKAHVIPEAFFRAIKDEDAVLKQRELGRHPKKMPTGVYDTKIWCEKCEKKYGCWDNYAIPILLKPLSEFTALPSAFELEIKSSKSIRLFFVSMLWRASTSTQRLFRNVSLGPFEDLAKKILISENFECIHHFSTVISSSGHDGKLIAEPVRLRHDEINFYRFYLGRFMVDIKVDKRPMSNKLLIATIGFHADKLACLLAPRQLPLVETARKIATEQLLS